MEFMHGLELNLDNVNQILKIAQEKGYVKSNEPFFNCDDFKFDEKNHKFEFHVLNPKTKYNTQQTYPYQVLYYVLDLTHGIQIYDSSHQI
jgi:hypothetical protein